MSGKKTASLLLTAVVLGAVGGGLSLLYLKAREADLIEALKPKSQPIEIVVAVKDLVKGDRLDASTLSVRAIPSDYVDPNAIKPSEFESIEGLVIIQNLASGKPLLRSFIDQEFPLDFSDTIPEKRRAMTIQVDETNTISGLIRPGNRIDLFVNMPPTSGGSDSKKGNEILPVVENIEVLSTGRDAAHDYEEKVRLMRLGFGVQPDQNFTSLTLNVTARNAALIALAQDKGNLLALLRNRKDNTASGFITVSTQTISSNARNLAREAADKAKYKPVGELTTNANGDVVDENGNIITGVTLNEDGTVTLSDGRKVDPSEITVGPNGELLLKNGEKIEGVSAVKPLCDLSANDKGEVVDSSGNVITGVKLNEDGTVTLPDGRNVDPCEIIINPGGGGISMKNGEKIEGVQVIPTAESADFDFEVDYIVGGVSQDSVATVNKLTVEENSTLESQE